jgi:SHS2 domain-containing protein
MEGKAEGRIEVMERQEIRRKWTLDGLKENRRYVLEIERRNAILYNVQNSIWYRLWTCRKTDSNIDKIYISYKIQGCKNISKIHEEPQNSRSFGEAK